MLRVTDAAVSAFWKLLVHEGPPGRAAIRIQRALTPEGEEAITFQSVQGPEEQDSVGQATGIDVFLDPNIAAPLGDAILDARETAEGTEMFLRLQRDGRPTA